MSVTLDPGLEARGQHVSDLADESVEIGPAVLRPGRGGSRLTLQRPWRDGTRALAFPPLAVLERLAAGRPGHASTCSSTTAAWRAAVVPGAILAVASWVTFNAVARYVWPLLGIELAG